MHGIIVEINYGGGGGEYAAASVETGRLVVPKAKRAIKLPRAVSEQFDPRADDFHNWLDETPDVFGPNSGYQVKLVVCRGPALRPDKNGQPNGFGIYAVNSAVIEAISTGHMETVHGSQFSVLVGQDFAVERGVPAIFADPISCMQLPDSGSITGHPDIRFKGLGHWLNIHEALNRSVFGENPWSMYNIIACHFGTGFTIAAFRMGQMVRVNNANAGGSFSDTRAGELPTEGLIDLSASRFTDCHSSQEMKDELQSGCGLLGLTGAKSLEACFELIDGGDKKALSVYEVMIERIAEEIVRRAVNLGGMVDGILLTGGMAQSERFVADVEAKIRFLTEKSNIPVNVVPGSLETEAMIKAGRQVLLEGVEPIQYGPLS